MTSVPLMLWLETEMSSVDRVSVTKVIKLLSNQKFHWFSCFYGYHSKFLIQRSAKRHANLAKQDPSRARQNK